MEIIPADIRLHSHHYPRPDAEGVAAIKALYKAERGRDLTDEEAHRVLSATMRFLWALNLPAGAEADAALNPVENNAPPENKTIYS